MNIRVITKLPNSEQSHKGKVKPHKHINRQNQSTTGKHTRSCISKVNVDYRRDRFYKQVLKVRILTKKMRIKMRIVSEEAQIIYIMKYNVYMILISV